MIDPIPVYEDATCVIRVGRPLVMRFIERFIESPRQRAMHDLALFDALSGTSEQRDRELFYQWLKHEFDQHAPRVLDTSITTAESCLRYLPIHHLIPKPVARKTPRHDPQPNRAPTGKRKRQWR